MRSASASESPGHLIEECPSEDTPAGDVFEITVFGKGVGECVAIHVGSGHWCLVDSFRHPESGKPAGLRYLQNVSVHPDQVALIVGTHFHMDHVAALSECVEACGKARIALPQAQFPDELLTLLKVEEFSQIRIPRRLRELKRIVDALGNNRDVRLAAAGTNVLPQPIMTQLADAHGVRPLLMSLSPSDATCGRIRQEWATLLQRSRSAVSSRLPHNDTSMVLVAGVGSARVLLGADLEESSRRGEGWKAVDDEWPRSQIPVADVLKVPHHGSYNADSAYLWRNLSQGPLGVIAPFTSGRTKVPRAGDIHRLQQHCAQVFGTSVPRGSEQPETDSPGAAALRLAGYQPMATEYGAVRMRRRITDENAPWSVAFFGSAGKIPPII